MPGSRDTLLTAARRAVDFDDRRLVAAALAAHRGLFTKIGAIDDDWVEIFEAALGRMTPDDPDRALVLATYCQEILIGTPLERRQALADEALAIATASGDETVIVRVLNNIAYALTSPPMLERSLARTAEGLERALHLGDPVLTFFAANWRRQACAQAGDVREMARCTEIMAELVDRLRQPTLTWVHTFGLAWLAMIRGDVATAERLANEAFVIGQESGQPDAEYIWGGQTIVIFHQRGVLDHLQPVIASMVAEHPQPRRRADRRPDRGRPRGRPRRRGPGADGGDRRRRLRARDEPAVDERHGVLRRGGDRAGRACVRRAPVRAAGAVGRAVVRQRGHDGQPDQPLPRRTGRRSSVTTTRPRRTSLDRRRCAATSARRSSSPRPSCCGVACCCGDGRDGDVETARGLLQRARDAGVAGDYRLIASRAERALATISD